MFAMKIRDPPQKLADFGIKTNCAKVSKRDTNKFCREGRRGQFKCCSERVKECSEGYATNILFKSSFNFITPRQAMI